MQTAWEDRSIFAPGLVDSAQSILEGLPGASVYHIDLEISDGLTRVDGEESVRYTNTETAALHEVQFRLFPNILGGHMDITTIEVDGQELVPRLSLGESVLHVALDPALEPGQSVTIRIDFSVEVPESLSLNYGVLAYAEGVLALAHFYPMVEVFDDEGWNAEIPPQSGDVTYADVSFYIVSVTAPKEVTLVATGRELRRSESGRAQTVTFAAGPARDFYVAASSDYQMTETPAGATVIRFYAPASLEEGVRAAADIAARALEDYGDRYAPYPYTELDFVATPTLALGIEYPGMIAITAHIIGPQEPYLEGTIAHEVAHQWFYNLVGNDQLDDPWLDESLAQFATLQYYTDEYGEVGAGGFRDSLLRRWSRVNGDLIPIGLPVAAYSDFEYGAIVYGRGPLFFEALRTEMGATKFDAFIKDYAQTYSWGIATPEGLQQTAESDCGCDLDPLFDAWVYP
jgi:aminopeptidase N